MAESNKIKIIQGKKVRRRSIRDKLLIGFVVQILFSIFLGAFGAIKLHEISARNQSLYSTYLTTVNEAYTIKQDLLEIDITSQQLIINLDDSMNSQSPTLDTRIAEVDDLLANLTSNSSSLNEQQGVTKIQMEWNIYKQNIQSFESFVTASDNAQAKSQLTKVSSSEKNVNEMVDAYITGQLTDAKATFEASYKGYQTSIIIMIIVCSIIMIAGIFIALYFSGWIAKTTRNFAKISTGLSVGDLNQHVVEKTNDEFGDLATSYTQMIHYFNNIKSITESIAENDLTVEIKPLSENDSLGNALLHMTNNLKQIMGQINDVGMNLGSASKQLAAASTQTGQASEQIAQTIQQVATGITQQSDSMTRAVSSIEQMDRAIEGVAKGAQEQSKGISQVSALTNKLDDAIDLATQSAEAQTENSEKTLSVGKETASSVAKTIESMHVIQEKVGQTARKVAEMGVHSDQINSIVETIEDISSQTNLLALNAAIEAARAGEQGKGFAVVADEVRKLAEKSSVSAKEIAQLIEGIRNSVVETSHAMQVSAETVAAGVEMANVSGETAKQILTIAESGQQTMQKIFSATQVMKSTSSDLVNAMDSVSAVIEENTASTEEMSAGGSQINQMIENMASVSEENSAAVEEISASTIEMSSQIEQVAESAESLANLAEELENLVKSFKLKA